MLQGKFLQMATVLPAVKLITDIEEPVSTKNLIISPSTCKSTKIPSLYLVIPVEMVAFEALVELVSSVDSEDPTAAITVTVIVLK